MKFILENPSKLFYRLCVNFYSDDDISKCFAAVFLLFSCAMNKKIPFCVFRLLKQVVSFIILANHELNVVFSLRFYAAVEMREAEVQKPVLILSFTTRLCYFFMFLFKPSMCEKRDMWTQKKNVSLLDFIKDFKTNFLSHVDTFIKRTVGASSKNFQQATNFPGTYFPIYILISSDSLFLCVL